MKPVRVSPRDERHLDQVGRAAARDAGGVDPVLLGGFLPAVLAATATRRRLRRQELRECAAAGRRAAAQGIALRVLVDLYLSAGWRLWRDVPAIATGDAEQVKAAALSVLRATDDGVAALVEGYQLALADLGRLHESTKRDVLDRLLAGGQQAIEATGPAADLGLVLSGPVSVLVARARAGFAHPAGAALPGRVERALQGRHGDAQPLVAVRPDELVCVFTAPDAAAVALVCTAVAAEIDSHAAGNPAARAAGTRDRAWRGAVSSPRTGAAAVRASLDEARQALEIADRLGLTQAVVDAAELAVYRVLLQDRPAVQDLIRSTLTPLTTARGGALALLETLSAYYATGCVATEAAARLYLSVRTVTYRLGRIAELIGRDPTDPAHRFTVQAAVMAAKLLDWPATPLDS
jgi:sugar diacid utilization regulator